MMEKIFNLIYPEKCPFCGMILKRGEVGICEKCRESLPYVREPRCMKCGKPISSEREEFCYDCKKRTHLFDGGQSLWVHQPPVDQAIYAFKYHDRRCYGKVFAVEMVRELCSYIKLVSAEALIPIPLYKIRYRDRGYNQAEILAREIGKITRLPMEDVLVRKKSTSPQKKLSDTQRKKNIEDAFALKREIEYKIVILIDDIYTTGSTLDEATKVLKSAGVSKVYFLTISIGQGF